jgi:hypothetical protein
MDFNRKNVKIMGVRYDIEYIDGHQVLEDKEWGSFEPFSRKIRLYNSKDNYEKFRILMHEVIHGIGEANHLDIHTKTLHKPGTPEGVETPEQERMHRQLDLLAHGITDFLFTNKLLKDT